MKVRTGSVLALVFGVLVAGSLLLGTGERHGAASAVTWEPSVGHALAKASAEGKLVMVDFYTDWCRWCRRLDETTLADPQVGATLREGFVAVRLNAEAEGKEEADRFGVDSYPTLVFLDSRGQEVYRISGYLEPRDFLAELSNVRAKS
ncbi:MAG: thioredoxin family protein [Thermoanaerobaculum sp.]